MSLQKVMTRIAHGGIRYCKVSRFSPSGMPYVIAHTSDGYVIKGQMLDPVEGDQYRFYGEFREQKNNRGMAFEFQVYEPIIDSSSPTGIIEFLSRHIPDVGKVRAKKIVDFFGLDCLSILRDEPHRVKECPGIPESVHEALEAYFEESPATDANAYVRLAEMFSKTKFPRKLIKKLLEDFSSAAPDIVSKNPYVLLNYPRMGWPSVDAWALAHAGYKPDGIERARAAIYEFLIDQGNEGHTWVALVDLKCGIAKYTKRPLMEDALEQLIETCQIIRDRNAEGRECLSLAYLHYAEKAVAANLVRLAETAIPLDRPYATHEVEGEQVDAVNLLSDSPVGILTGGAGTGKSWVTVHIIKDLIKQGHRNIGAVAPTGKAAKVLQELLDDHVPGSEVIVTTIHRALMPGPSDAPLGVPKESAKQGRGRDEFEFRHGESNKLSWTAIVIDESSMVDCLLAKRLLDSLNDTTRVIFVGDPNQLPSVQAGAFLRDMISGGVPTARLIEPRRNSGRIVTSCHEILKGRVPRPSPKFDLAIGENWRHIEEADPAKCAEIIVSLFNTTKRDPLWDMQVITAENNIKPIACSNLNRLLSQKLNPSPAPVGGQNGESKDNEDPGSNFRPGDKVIRKKNGKATLLTRLRDADDEELYGYGDTWTWNGDSYLMEETSVVNGDFAIVKDIVEQHGRLYVVAQFRYPERLCRMTYHECHLSLAYAITVHAGQGSGFPYVIVPIHSCFYHGLMTRELLYTAISRAQDVLVTVGQMSEIERMVGRKMVGVRKTRLAEFIRVEVAKWEEETGLQDVWTVKTGTDLLRSPGEEGEDEDGDDSGEDWTLDSEEDEEEYDL